MTNAKIHLFLQNKGKAIIKICKTGMNIWFIVTSVFLLRLNFAISKRE